MTDFNFIVAGNTPTKTFNHFWDVVGNDRAAVNLRTEVQDALEASATVGFKYVRFHGLLDDEMGLWRDNGGVAFRTLYMDILFDKLLAIGLKPYVELSYMPLPLASGSSTINWYQGNTSVPTSYTAWGALMGKLVSHLIERYGVDEVATWRFEVWNEPDLNGWAGGIAGYMQLYAEAYKAMKQVSSRVQVGGPATSQIKWLPEFLAGVKSNNVGVDFISTHVYPNDPQSIVFGSYGITYPFEEVGWRAMQVARKRIADAGFGGTPLVISEWAAQNPATIAHMLVNGQGLCDSMCYWAASSMFEEGGPTRAYADEYFGLVDIGNVPRPSWHVFNFFNKLGNTRYSSRIGAPGVICPSAGGFNGVLWNLPVNSDVAKKGSDGADKSYSRLTDTGAASLKVTILDPRAYPPDTVYAAAGMPQSPTSALYDSMRSAALSTTTVGFVNGRAEVDVSCNAVAYIETEIA